MGDKINNGFRYVAAKVCEWIGTPVALLLALLLVFGWAFAGPFFKWSDGHQLFINTITTVITFWMVFLIQNTQNRDSKALHLKLDELIRSHADARNDLVSLESMTDDELAILKAEFADVTSRHIPLPKIKKPRVRKPPQ